MLHCPVCNEMLDFRERTAVCTKGHSFDIAKEGYINLLRSSKSGDRIGDDKQSARCRRDFLNKGYYAPLRTRLIELLQNCHGSLLDICCGEGYYTSALGERTQLDVYGFDISREMVRLAAKRGGARYFVANMSAIPVAQGSFDYATHLFAPFHERSFSRILKPGGRLFTVIPGSRHLFGLKQAVYNTPYRNDEVLPQTETLRFLGRERVEGEILLSSQEDIDAVFRMTPYYFHTSQKDKEKLLSYCELKTEISFVIGIYEKP